MLRAAAVVLVVVNHAGFTFVPGQLGVTIFFAISGFIITHLVLKEQERTNSFRAERFYINRVTKLAPPFITLIAIPTLIYAWFNSVSWWAFASQVFFVFNWVQIFDAETAAHVLPGSGVTWSLAVEEQFYICFAILWIAMVRLSWSRTILCFFAFAAIFYATFLRFSLEMPAQEMFFVRATTTRLDSIAWGVLAAVLFARLAKDSEPRRLITVLGSPIVPFISVAMIAGSFFGPEPLAFTFQSLGTILLILWGLLSDGGRIYRSIMAISNWRIVNVTGLASYSIYLAHAPIIFWIGSELLDLPNTIAVKLAYIAAGIFTGIVCWRFIEMPVLSWRHRNIDSRFKSAAIIPAQQ